MNPFGRDKREAEHPAETLGIDPYDFCAFGPRNALRPADRSREATLIERAMGVVDHYKRQSGEQG